MKIISNMDIIHPTTYEEPASTRSGKINLVDLPSGTVLFRAIHLKPENEGKDIFTDLLGRLSGTTACLSPTQNTYTFPFPYIGFGLYDWASETPSWQKYNAFIVYVLTQSHPFVNMINPSPDVRGTPKGNGVSAEITRCDHLGTHCPGDSKEYLKWDNCINRNYLDTRGVIGNISIAELDSIDVEKSAKGGKKGYSSLPPKDSSLGQYLKTLNPETATVALTQFYTCSPTDPTGRRLRTHRGIPEITLYSNKLLTHRPLTRPLRTIEEASRHYNTDMHNNAFTILPLAIITANNIYDILAGPSPSPVNTSSPSPLHGKTAIESNLQRFMTVAQETGIPAIGKIAYDRRTGFYVVKNMVPNNPFPSWLTNTGEPVTYREHLLDDLDTLSSKSNAIISAISQKKPAETSEFIFERPSSLRKLFSDLDIAPVPISNTIITPEILFSFDTVEGGKRKPTKTRKRKHGGRTPATLSLSLSPPPMPTIETYRKNTNKKTLKNKKNTTMYTSMPILLPIPSIPITSIQETSLKKAINLISATTKTYLHKIVSQNSFK